jgi:ubiquinone/menaquinone biosynthesis C-methylase UbiE
MKVNWPERLWVNSPVRRFVQQREAVFFKRLHSLPSGGRYLEIGCGCGVGAGIIWGSFAPSAIYALDIDTGMLQTAKRKTANWQSDRLHLLAADAQQLPFAENTFDAVFNYGIIHHLEDWQQGIAETARVLKNKGVFYFEEIYPPLYANFLLRHIVVHPRENRFHGPQYRAALEGSALRLLGGYKESRFAILGAAVKEE